MAKYQGIVGLLIDHIKRWFERDLYTEPAPAGARPVSIFIRELDCGSCNACEAEINALTNPYYDMGRLGFHIVASPRHADVLLVTGPCTRNMVQAAKRTFEAMPEPRRVVTVGDCFTGKCIFTGSYAIEDLPTEIQARVVANIPGCPPSPNEILEVLAGLHTE